MSVTHYIWRPIEIKTVRDERYIKRVLKPYIDHDCRAVLYYTPQRQWWGYRSSSDPVPVDVSGERTVMTTDGLLVRVSNDVILRAARSIREGFPDAT